jgi:16S rRNA (guanine527-N7)-methyltransferase
MMAFLSHLRSANAFLRTSLRAGSTTFAFAAAPSQLAPLQISNHAVQSKRHNSLHTPQSYNPPNTQLQFSSSIDTSTEIDPYSEQAKQNLSAIYSNLDPAASSLINTDVDKAHKSLLKLTEQVLAWNQRLNLVSRKECTASVIYHRHVLPSVALLPLLCNQLLNTTLDDNKSLNIVDVGTGGGFPGLPLAVLLPQFQFTLVDSIQKKLVAVSEMASELDITNVRVHCGRVEEMMYNTDVGKVNREHYNNYDIVLGRSVTALPRFCAWVSDLLKQKDGRLIYIIGGELEDIVEERIESDTNIDTLLNRQEGTSDKRALIFTAWNVEEIAEQSGEKYNIVRSGEKTKKQQKKSNSSSGNDGKTGKKLAKGEWNKKRNDVKKDRGYDDFKRYEF